MPLELAEIKNRQEISFYIAAGVMGILVLEGLRYWRVIVADREDSESSDFANMPDLAQGGGAVNARFGNVASAYILVHLMLSAPRLTAQSIHTFRGLLHATPEAVAQAAIMYRRLTEARKWTPMSECRECGAGVFLLVRLQLIWTRLEDGEQQLRIPPGTPAGLSADH